MIKLRTLTLQCNVSKPVDLNRVIFGSSIVFSCISLVVHCTNLITERQEFLQRSLVYSRLREDYTESAALPLKTGFDAAAGVEDWAGG